MLWYPVNVTDQQKELLLLVFIGTSHTVSSSSITLAVLHAILHADILASFIRHSNAALPDIDDEIGKLGAEAKLENFAINTWAVKCLCDVLLIKCRNISCNYFLMKKLEIGMKNISHFPCFSFNFKASRTFWRTHKLWQAICAMSLCVSVCVRVWVCAVINNVQNGAGKWPLKSRNLYRPRPSPSSS